jgi:FMN phosphatase YigB (HAD superfamily)
MKRPEKQKIIVPSGVVVWVDVDGVLLDFRSFFHKVLKEKAGIQLADDYMSPSWTWDEVLKNGQFTEIFNALPNNWTENLKVYKGASDFTHLLKKMGCHVNIITDVKGPSTIYRIKNLEKNKIFFDAIFFTHGHAKSEFITPMMDKYVDPEGNPAKHIFIDDRAKNVDDFLSNIPGAELGVTIDYPYNSVELAEMPKKYSLRVFSFSSKTPQEMFTVVFDRVMEIRKN